MTDNTTEFVLDTADLAAIERRAHELRAEAAHDLARAVAARLRRVFAGSVRSTGKVAAA